MRTEHIIAIWSYIRNKGDASPEENWFKPPSSIPTARSNAVLFRTLRKQAYLNILKILLPKNENV